jgi:hypothetical protein
MITHVNCFRAQGLQKGESYTSTSPVRLRCTQDVVCIETWPLVQIAYQLGSWQYWIRSIDKTRFATLQDPFGFLDHHAPLCEGELFAKCKELQSKSICLSKSFWHSSEPGEPLLPQNDFERQMLLDISS